MCPSSDKWLKETHNAIICNYNKEQSSTIYNKMDAARGHHVEWNKTDLERQILDILPSMWELQLNKELKNKEIPMCISIVVKPCFIPLSKPWLRILY